MYNAYELDEDQRNYEALVAKVHRDKLNSSARLRKAGWGGVVRDARDLPGYEDRLRAELMSALAPYTDSQGNITIVGDESWQ